MSPRSRRSIVLASSAVVALAAAPFLISGAPSRATSPAARGEYLVNAMGCADCHTPWHMGPDGPEPDSSRHLSGHPAALAIDAEPPAAAAPWGVHMSLTHTAWAGPWGVSFTANLTPDRETGLGAWTEEMFVEALRSGRHMGRGRPILPPMPWFAINKLDDGDLKAVFAYLRSIEPVANKVPEPLPPAAAR